METYQTKAGDMFDLISYRQFGSENYLEKLFNENRAKLFTFVFSANETLNIPNITKEKISRLPPWMT